MQLRVENLIVYPEAGGKATQLQIISVPQMFTHLLFVNNWKRLIEDYTSKKK